MAAFSDGTCHGGAASTRVALALALSRGARLLPHALLVAGGLMPLCTCLDSSHVKRSLPHLLCGPEQEMLVLFPTSSSHGVPLGAIQLLMLRPVPPPSVTPLLTLLPQPLPSLWRRRGSGIGTWSPIKHGIRAGPLYQKDKRAGNIQLHTQLPTHPHALLFSSTRLLQPQLLHKAAQDHGGTRWITSHLTSSRPPSLCRCVDTHNQTSTAPEFTCLDAPIS